MKPTLAALFSFFLPLIVCCGGGVLIAFMFMGAWTARIISGQQMQFSLAAPGELDHTS